MSGLVRVVDFLTRAHVTGVGNGQVNCAHTGCSRQTPALHVHFARPIWLALEGVARGVCQFIGQNIVWEGDGWVWGEGKSSPPLLWKKMWSLPSSPTLLPPDLSLQTHWRRLALKRIGLMSWLLFWEWDYTAFKNPVTLLYVYLSILWKSFFFMCSWIDFVLLKGLVGTDWYGFFWANTKEDSGVW